MTDTSFTVPDAFRARMIEVFGDDGRDWLTRLPSIIASIAWRWNLTVGPAVSNLSYNWVAPATRENGERVMLKVGVPHSELWSEIEALRVYADRGIARLIDADAELGALLLERLEPGRTLVALSQKDDEQATEIAAMVMRDLWTPLSDEHPFRSVADWATGMARIRSMFEGGTGPLPTNLFEQAESLFSQLLPSMDAPVLLHGDLHHENILSATRSPWLAIDPKGIVGEPVYETGALLRNPWPEVVTRPNVAQVLSRRIDQLSEILGFDHDRIRAWGISQAVLSACWTVEDGGDDWGYAIRVAELLKHG